MTTKELADLSFKVCEPACHKGIRLLFFVVPNLPVIGLDTTRFVAALATTHHFFQKRFKVWSNNLFFRKNNVHRFKRSIELIRWIV